MHDGTADLLAGDRGQRVLATDELVEREATVGLGRRGARWHRAQRHDRAANRITRLVEHLSFELELAWLVRIPDPARRHADDG